MLITQLVGRHDLHRRLVCCRLHILLKKTHQGPITQGRGIEIVVIHVHLDQIRQIALFQKDTELEQAQLRNVIV